MVPWHVARVSPLFSGVAPVGRSSPPSAQLDATLVILVLYRLVRPSITARTQRSRTKDQLAADVQRSLRNRETRDFVAPEEW